MVRNQIIISLGSNKDAEKNMKTACDALDTLLPALFWSDAVETEAEGCSRKSMFLNRVGMGFTYMSIDELKMHFKLIDTFLGRTPEDKAQGIIPIDIDLLKWNEEVLKADDMQRYYVVEGMERLRIY